MSVSPVLVDLERPKRLSMERERSRIAAADRGRAVLQVEATSSVSFRVSGDLDLASVEHLRSAFAALDGIEWRSRGHRYPVGRGNDLRD
jgi:hypothetical protein